MGESRDSHPRSSSLPLVSPLLPLLPCIAPCVPLAPTPPPPLKAREDIHPALLALIWHPPVPLLLTDGCPPGSITHLALFLAPSLPLPTQIGHTYPFLPLNGITNALHHP